MYTHLEDYINNLYQIIKITNPADLDMQLIAKRLGIDIVYRRTTFRLGNEIILSPDTKQREWEKFGHELCHYLIHFGHQLNMHYLFRDLQEYQSTRFAYHFCIPTFMLVDLQIKNVCDIAALFNVEYEFALKRLEMYERKMLYARSCC